MIKRITALLVAVVIPITLIFTACGKQSAEIEVTRVEFSPEGAQLTDIEYQDALMLSMDNYAMALTAVPLYEDNDTVEKLKPHWEEAKESCRKCNEALDGFGKINPPKEFVEKHKKLLEGVNNEKEYVAAMERFLTSRNDKDLKKYSEEFGRLADRPIDQTLSGMFLELYKEIDELTGANAVTSQL